MFSRVALRQAVAKVDPCHFPSLVYDAAKEPLTETSSTQIALPTLPLPGSNGIVISYDELSKFAFVLLLKAYTRSDQVSYGLLQKDHQVPFTAQFVTAGLDADSTLYENSQHVLTAVLIEQTELEIVQQVDRLVNELGTLPFNATLHLATQSKSHSVQPLENVFGSNILLGLSKSGTQGEYESPTLNVSLSYKTDFLDQFAARNILTTFETVLQLIAVNISSPLKSINLISAHDLCTIRSWNAVVPSPVHQTLNDQFEATFRDNADREAVYTTNGSFTYREMDDLSTIIAVRLIELGVKPNTIVPIFMSKSRWSVCAIAAVWKAGGAIATMDPAYPDERLLAIINEFKAGVIITDPEERSRFDDADVRVVTVAEDLSKHLEEHGLPVPRDQAWKMSGVRPGDLAVVAFTSGSSGKPKGVLHSHGRLTSEHQSYIWNMEYKGGSRILQFASYAFIASVGETQRSFSHGATLCVPSEEERLSSLTDFIRRSRARRSYMTPSLVRTINPKDVPSLEILCVGGESIPKDLEEIWGPHVHFIQVYGATEGGFMARDPKSQNHNKKGLSPVGGLTWLVDAHDSNKLVPVGAVGEIVFESHELALGYLNDLEKTARTFLDPPAWAKERPEAAGCRYLRNGDLGRYEADGSVSPLGRADMQVKINGQRVELGDVESNLRVLLPFDWTIVVDLVKPFDALDRPVLTTFVRPSPGSQKDGLAVLIEAKSRLEKLLPRHMIPRACVVLEEIPGHYKTDRRKLRNEASNLGIKALIASLPNDGNSTNVVAPATNTERVLANLWATILRQDVDIIGREQSFISLGGDSLAAINLVSAARSNGLELTVQKILGQPVLQDMANGVRSAFDQAQLAKKETVNQQVAASSVSNTTVSLRATDFQEWAALAGSQNGGWIDHFTYDLRGAVNIEKLQRSCKLLVATHSVLRSVFKLHEGQVWTELTSDEDVAFNTYQATADELEDKTKEIYARERLSPLGKPIVRFDLLQVSHTWNRLVLRLSHAQYDGFSATMFERNLGLLYSSQALPYALDFYDYLAEIQKPVIVSAAEHYWRGQLEGSIMPTLVNRKTGSAAYTNALDGELKFSISTPSLVRNGINTATVIKTGWALAISALSRSADVVFGEFKSGRQVPIRNVDTVIGPCVNFLPVRVQVKDGSKRIELLETVQEQAVLSIPHEALGFRHIIQNCTAWGDASRYSSIVNFINLEEELCGPYNWAKSDDGVDINLESLYEERQHDKTDLWLLCRPARAAPGRSSSRPAEEKAETFELYLRYSKSLYSGDAVERIAGLYKDAVESLVTSLDERVAVSRVSDEERSLLIPSSV